MIQPSCIIDNITAIQLSCHRARPSVVSLPSVAGRNATRAVAAFAVIKACLHWRQAAAHLQKQGDFDSPTHTHLQLLGPHDENLHVGDACFPLVITRL